jgi:hypothetical protein
MKSPARLGEIAPSTSMPSTGVETRSAGDAGGAGTGAGREVAMARFTLGEAYDSASAHAVAVGTLG